MAAASLVSGRPGKNLALLSLGVWICGVLFLAVGDSLLETAGDAAQLGRQDSNVADLTGRLPLWNDLLASVEERPVFGHGYGGFWIPQNIDELIRSQGWVVTSAHSAYLECLLDIGVPGLLFYVFMIVGALAAAVVRFKRTSEPVWGFVACLMLFCLMQGVSESAMAMLPQFATLLVFLGIVHLALGGSDDGQPVPARAVPLAGRPEPRLVWTH
jgi:O-antigen ligase